MLTYGHINGGNHPVAAGRDMLDRPANDKAYRDSLYWQGIPNREQ
jgi:hypothetical protein